MPRRSRKPPLILEGFKTIALAKEIESPENPGGLDNRVALMPKNVERIAAEGVEFFVERGAGKRMGFADSAYVRAGARMQSARELYRDKDLIVNAAVLPASDRGKRS